MCGIAGVWTQKDQIYNEQSFNTFLNSLKHRGPDGAGVSSFDSGRFWLGHRRLSILDITDAGHQPMKSSCSRFSVSFNGEIFNYIELKNELKNKGFIFKTNTDTEVLLASFIEWGPDCQLKFNGMWAFAVWDDLKKELFLSRDRFGVKPLYYLLKDNNFYFASELKSFLKLRNIKININKKAFQKSIQNMIGMEGTSETWLDGIKRLQAGNQLTFNLSGVPKIKRYWCSLDYIEKSNEKYNSQVSEFRELFFDSCRIRLRSDVPIATSLSGGLDSSSVFGSLYKIGKNPGYSKNWKTAFIAGFSRSSIDEKKYAIEMANYLDAQYVINEIDEKVIKKDFEKVIFHFEEVNSVLHLGIWQNYKSMKAKGISVSIDGHGADEMLGGYNFISEHEMNLSLEKKQFLQYFKYRKIYKGFLGGSGDMREASLKSELKKVWRHTKIARLFRAYQRKPILNFSPPPLTEFLGDKSEYENDLRFQSMSSLNQKLYIYFHYTILPTILRNFDRGSMGHGLEARMPFMDWRLVVFCFGLPDDSKIGGGFPKRILRSAMKGLMPDSIRLRTNKIGFTSPMADWVQNGLKEPIFDALHSRDFLKSDYFDGEGIKKESLELFKHKKFESFAATCWPAVNGYFLGKMFRN